MAILVYAKVFGYKKAKIIKVVLFGLLALFLFFAPLKEFLFNLLSWSYTGIPDIPAKILAILLILVAWDAYYTG